MEQLVIVGILLLLSIVEASARRKRGDGTEPVGPADPGAGESLGGAAAAAEAPRRYAQPERSVPAAVVPDDVWADIARLAGGGPAVEPRAEHTRVMPGQAIHATHPDFGKRPVDRKTPAPALQVAAAKSEELAAVRGMFAGGAPALRRAVILDEVLGPPAAMRGDPFEPVG